MPDAAKRKTMDDLGYEEEWSPFDATAGKQYFGKYRGTVVANRDTHALPVHSQISTAGATEPSNTPPYAGAGTIGGKK